MKTTSFLFVVMVCMATTVCSYPALYISESNMDDSTQDNIIPVRKRRQDMMTLFSAGTMISLVLLNSYVVSNGKLPEGYSANFKMIITNELGHKLENPFTFVKHGKLPNQ